VTDWELHRSGARVTRLPTRPSHSCPLVRSRGSGAAPVPRERFTELRRRTRQTHVAPGSRIEGGARSKVGRTGLPSGRTRQPSQARAHIMVYRRGANTLRVQSRRVPRAGRGAPTVPAYRAGGCHATGDWHHDRPVVSAMAGGCRRRSGMEPESDDVRAGRRPSPARSTCGVPAKIRR
jgi:hypothetical protein